MTPVIFKLEDGKPLAVFPALPWSVNTADECACYAHLGQHSACAISYASSLPPATPEQYAPLLAELKGQGYDNLKIVRRFTQRHYADRRVVLAAQYLQAG